MTSARHRLLLVHAHPDDETLATGGTIARYAADPDTAVTLVTCTLGEEGEVVPAELRGLAPTDADQLGGYRIGELAAACAALGVVDHRFLGGAGRWRDSGMALAGHGIRAATPDPLHPRAFARPAAFDAQLAALVEIVREVDPQVVVSYGADGGYGHPDHVRAHDLTVAALPGAACAARRFAVVRARTTLDAGLAGLACAPGLPFVLPAADDLPSVDDRSVGTRIDVRSHRAARIAALRAHRTQLSVWEGPPVAYALSNGVAQPMLEVEEYELAGPGPGPAPSDDLFGVV